jgi:hypothetical protein
MTLSKTDPKQAWRMVLDQLQMEMSKASYDTWVRDTEFVAFETHPPGRPSPISTWLLIASTRTPAVRW